MTLFSRFFEYFVWRGRSINEKPMYKPYPKNVPGPVYVGDGCCLSCGIWENEAPEHFSWDDGPDGGSHCYVSKQPETDEQFEMIIDAMAVQELDCIRVKGCSSHWRDMMVERKQGEFLDD